MTTTLPEQRMSNPFGIARIAHVCIFVRDIERTIRFYRDCLGMPLTFRFMKKGRLVMLKTRKELEGEDLTELYIQYMEEREG